MVEDSTDELIAQVRRCKRAIEDSIIDERLAIIEQLQQLALHSQSQLSDVPFKELHLSISNFEHRQVEKRH